MARQFPPGDPTLIARSLEIGEREGMPVAISTSTRGYDTDAADLWSAVTTPERLARWFLPVSGDLREGGRYQFEGNAGGTITVCRAPERIEATWEFGGGTSWVEVTVSSRPAGTATLTLTHISPMDPDFWRRYGPGATGVGWDLAFDGLARYLVDPDHPLDEAAIVASEAGRAFIQISSTLWGEASIAAGTPVDQALSAAANSAAFFTGMPEPGP